MGEEARLTILLTWLYNRCSLTVNSDYDREMLASVRKQLLKAEKEKK